MSNDITLGADHAAPEVRRFSFRRITGAYCPTSSQGRAGVWISSWCGTLPIRSMILLLDLFSFDEDGFTVVRPNIFGGV
jgi:hypothetical protein